MVADGASGASTSAGAGGLGGEYSAQVSGLPVSGELLTVSTGGAGGNSAGGAGGGGAGTTDSVPGTSGGGGSAYPAAAATISGFQVTPAADSSHNSGNGQVTISFANVRTALTASLSFNSGQTYTLEADLTAGAGGHPVAGEPVDFSTGTTGLRTGVVTNSRGHARCVLTYSQMLRVQLNGGTFTESFAGGVGLTPAYATGVSSWWPWA